MRILIVATSKTPPNIQTEIQAGRHHRIDYLELAAQFHSTYVDYNAIPAHRPMRWLEEALRLDLRLAFRVAHLVRAHQYDVVFSLSERVGIPLALLLDRRVKHIVHFHHPLSPLKLPLLIALRIPYRWTAMIVLTRQTAQVLRQKLSLGEERIKVLHSPIDTKFYDAGRFATLPQTSEHILALGLSHRDYPTLIRAMRQLSHIPCEVRAGSAWVNRASGLEHEPMPCNVVLKPFVPPDPLRSVYVASRFVVVPIRRTTLWSAGCTTITMAQAMAKPVITTRNPGIGDYVVEGETGILVEPSDPQAMADAIECLWNDPTRITRMSQRAREWAMVHFSLDHWLARVTELIHALE